MIASCPDPVSTHCPDVEDNCSSAVRPLSGLTMVLSPFSPFHLILDGILFVQVLIVPIFLKLCYLKVKTVSSLSLPVGHRLHCTSY